MRLKTFSLHRLERGEEPPRQSTSVHFECDDLIFLFSAGKNRLDPPWRLPKVG